MLDLFDFNHVELLSHLGRCQASLLAVVVVVEADGAIALESEALLDVRWGKQGDERAVWFYQNAVYFRVKDVEFGSLLVLFDSPFEFGILAQVSKLINVIDIDGTAKQKECVLLKDVLRECLVV